MWDKAQIREFVRDVIESWGKKGWGKLSYARRRLELHSKAISVVVGQHAETVEVEAVRALVRDLETEAGLAG